MIGLINSNFFSRKKERSVYRNFPIWRMKIEFFLGYNMIMLSIHASILYSP